MSKGFLLFEVLVAILIASTALVVLMQGLGNSLRGGNVASAYFKGSILAEAQLAMLEREGGVKAGTESGRFSEEQDPDGKFSWEQKVTPIITTTLIGTTELPVCEVEISVKWKERTGERDIKLFTYLPKYEESPAER